MQRPSRPPLPALTSLRFVAAFHVVLFHVAAPYSDHAPWWWRNIVGTGYVGVSLFFVLSGFILAYNYIDDRGALRVKPKEFFVARFARVYPVYALALIVALPFFVTRALRPDFGVSRALATFVSAPLLVQAWTPATACVWNCPGWSLSVEAFFYAVFPVVALWLACHERPLAVACVLWLLALAAPLAYLMTAPDGVAVVSATTRGAWLTALKFHPLARLPEFLVGIALGVWYLRPHRRRLGDGGVLLATVAILTALVLSDRIPYVLLHNGVLVPAFGLLIVSLADGGATARAISFRTALLLGEASYALYILHQPLWRWVTNMAEPLKLGPDSPVVIVASIVLSVAASVVVLRSFEDPARRWIRGALSKRAHAA